MFPQACILNLGIEELCLSSAVFLCCLDSLVTLQIEKSNSSLLNATNKTLIEGEFASSSHYFSQ